MPGSDRSERGGGELAVVARQRLADRDRNALRHPEPRQRAPARVERPGASPARARRRPKLLFPCRRRSTACSGLDDDPQRVRERRGRDVHARRRRGAPRCAGRPSPLVTRSRLRPSSGASAVRTCGLHARRAADDRDLADGEQRRLERGDVGADGEADDGQRDRDRPGARGRDGRAASARGRALRRPRLAATGGSSPPRAASLQGRQLERPEEADLVLERDAEALVDAAPRLRHQRERIGARRSARVLDEVRVPRARSPRRRSGAPSARTPRSGCPAPGPAGGFLKTLPKVRLVVGCVCLAPGEQLGDLRLDLGRRPRREAEARPRRPPRRSRAPSGGRRARAPPAASRRAAGGADDDARRARSRASRCRRRRRSSARRRRPCPGSPRRTRSRRGRRRAPGGGRPRSPRRRRRRASRPRRATAASSPASRSTSASTPASATSRFEPSPIVSTATPRRRPRTEHLLELVDGLGPREVAGRAAGADRREARERDALLEQLDHRRAARAGRAAAPARGRRRRRRARAARRPAAPAPPGTRRPSLERRESSRRAGRGRRARRRRACR